MTQIRWGRVVLLAVALEAVLFATLVPLLSRLSQNILFAVIALACAVFGYLAGWLAGRGLSSGAVLNGVLAGVLATIIYLVICAVNPGGIPAAVAFYGAPLFVGINGLRIVGCAAGALTAKRPAAVTAAAKALQ